MSNMRKRLMAVTSMNALTYASKGKIKTMREFFRNLKETSVTDITMLYELLILCI